jgi:uncharacterized protein
MEELTALHYGLIAVCSLVAGTIGGVAGYGTGLLMPLVLTPLVGPEAVVPIIGASALLTNGSRVAAFRTFVEPRRALVIAAAALPGCILGAYGYALLAGRGATLLIGTVLVLMVPVRWLLAHWRTRLSHRGVAVAGAGYGVLVGGTSGSGVVLLAILLASGLNGRAVVATDAAISMALGFVKTSTFQMLGAMTPSAWLAALVVGVAAAPGAFIARRLTGALPVKAHNGILDGAIVAGGLIMVAQGLDGS